MSTESKTTLDTKTIATLQQLVGANIDSRDGLAKVAEQMDVPSIARMMKELAASRNQQVSELRTLVSANNVEPESSGSVTASAHRLWIDIKAIVGGGRTTILAEAVRGEEYLKGQYEQVLLSNPGTAVNDVLNRHIANVMESSKLVKELQETYRDF